MWQNDRKNEGWNPAGLNCSFQPLHEIENGTFVIQKHNESNTVAGILIKTAQLHHVIGKLNPAVVFTSSTCGGSQLEQKEHLTELFFFFYYVLKHQQTKAQKLCLSKWILHAKSGGGKKTGKHRLLQEYLHKKLWITLWRSCLCSYVHLFHYLNLYGLVCS